MTEITAKALPPNTNYKTGGFALKEDSIVKELKQGSAQALGNLIDRYSSYVYSIISRIIGYRYEDSRELASDVFLAVWNNKHKLKEGKLKAYIGEIARNKAFNFLRSQKEELPLDEEILFNGESPGDYAENRELALILRKALSQLQPKKKELLLRHYYYGQRIADAARDMNINASSARVWIKRGRQELGDILRKENIEL